MDVSAGRGRARVFGRLRPGNEVKRTLISEDSVAPKLSLNTSHKFWFSRTFQYREQLDINHQQTAKMLIPKADRKKIHEYLFREGVLVAKKDYNLPKHNDIDTKNLYVVKACQSLTSRGYVKTQFSWQYYYYTLTPEGLDYLREWLHLPAEIVPATHIKQQRSHAPPRGMMGGEGERERKPFGGRGGRGGDRDGGREGGYRRREAGGEGKEGAPSGEFAPQFRGGFGRGAPPAS
ncbi:hypothetical protein MBM_09045 [Drepanopeziza brunnea f. sp. 'multigermtubi' MB_m1]|uniref:Plectin/eS10 N-terminal domain-containing protein n=1 Tax=Marssonina brunnea f. sp. multigermtubi (strain MB_m1) TaxID=1072389 RepID=K1WIY4_MARBU|nr:uncharacterized protein MBM_09045 [Drepanopeziza brunnea f. sp. 'multigermtubi' MB_m1]EKD12816.1 hypothetical protein MBM_09045 [Drepanopeziza brunnea f. sp. 'multigermtubi' MB_m1]